MCSLTWKDISAISFSEKKYDFISLSRTWGGYIKMVAAIFFVDNGIKGNFDRCFLLPVFYTKNTYFIYNKILVNMYSSGS